MNILIVYGSYSGGTQQVAELMEGTLKEHGHTPTLQNVLTTKPSDFANFDVVILGSNSWYEQREEGNMHSGFIKLAADLAADTFAQKKTFVFGLGDSNMYTATFTGGVDKLIQMVKDHGGEVSAEALRINRFYFERDENEQKIIDWIDQISQSL